jgi:hypothetical protein
MGREEQSGRDARGPQSGSEMIASDVAPPVPSPIPSAVYGRGLG